MSQPSESRTITIYDRLERALKISVNIGFHGMFITGGGLLLYVVGGTIAILLGKFDPSYTHLALDSDPFVTIGGALTGLFIVLGTGSLVLRYLLAGFDDERSQFVLIMSFTGLGCGAAVLRATLVEAFTLLSKVL